MFLGIDLGTSAVKTCVLSRDGSIVGSASVPLTVQHPVYGASEQNPDDWWSATCQAIAALDPALRRQVEAIGLSGQMHGAVLLDGQCRPICPAMLWNDARAQSECDAMLAALPDIGEITGVYPMAGFTAPKLLWLSRNAPDAHAKIAHILLPKDYIGLQLHGALVTDPSDAAGTSWMDQSTRRWSEAACAASMTDPAWLPEIRYGSDVVGALRAPVAEALGLRANIPVVAGAGDAAAGAIGIGATQNGDAFVSLGTSGQFFVTTDAYRPNVDNRLHAYAHTLPGVWFQMAAMLNGARPMAWLAELLDRPIGDLLVEAEAATESPLFLPYLTGERTPHGNTNIRAGFLGLGETTTHGGMMRAVIEAIAFSFADAARALHAAGTHVDVALAIGGGTKSDFLMQTMADVLECRLGRSTDSDVGPALGAARLAWVSQEPQAADTILSKPDVQTWFDPNPENANRLAGKLAAYRAVYPALEKL